MIICVYIELYSIQRGFIKIILINPLLKPIWDFPGGPAVKTLCSHCRGHGGWDTTIRKTQYEKLFYNQQYSMVSVDDSVYSDVEETKPIEHKEVVKKPHSQSKPVVSFQPVKQPIPILQPAQTEADIKEQLEALTVDSIVYHKKFGKGTIVKLNKNEKFIYIKFAFGEKKFVYPDAFLMGFLVVESEKSGTD